MKLTRRDTIALAAAASALSLAGVQTVSAKDGDHVDLLKLMAAKGPADIVMGNPDAKVTVIEYASPTCPHCAQFSNDVFPVFKSTYIDTGKVQFIMRPFARNLLDAAVFMLAQTAVEATPEMTPAAAPADGSTVAPVLVTAKAATYENVVSTFFKTQGDWGISDKPRDAILAVASSWGLPRKASTRR